jgi:hypothetical protein
MHFLKNKSLNTQSAQLHILFISVVLLTVCAAWALAAFHSFLPAKTPIDPAIIYVGFRDYLRPEPVERFVFLILALAIPICTFCAGLIVFRKAAKVPGTSAIRMTALVLLGAALFYLPFAGFQSSLAKDSLGGPSRFLAYQSLAFVGLAATFGLAAFWYFSRADRVPKHNANMHARTYQFNLLSTISHTTYRRVSWVIFLLLIALQIGSWRLFSEASMTRGAAWFDSFDAVIYSVGQSIWFFCPFYAAGI